MSDDDSLDKRPTLLTPATVGKWLGKSEKTLERWRAAGTGPAYVKIGNNVRYQPRAVHGFIDTSTVPADARPNGNKKHNK